MADGPAAGLALVEGLAAGGELAGYHLLPATRGDLLRRLDHLARSIPADRLPRLAELAGTAAGAAAPLVALAASAAVSASEKAT